MREVCTMNRNRGLKSLDQQVVVVFGASSGIGRETALQHAARGAKVVVPARGASGLESLVAEIEKQEGQALAIPAEVVNFEEVQAVARRAVEAYGRIDTWVHLAAVSMYATFEQTQPDVSGGLRAVPEHLEHGDQHHHLRVPDAAQLLEV